MALNMDAALTIRARTVGTQSVDKLNESLRKTTGRADKAGGGLAAAGGQARKGSGGFVAMKGAVEGLAAAFAASAITRVVKNSIEVFREFETDSLKLEQGLKLRGEAFTAMFEELNKEADRLGNVTLFNNDEFRKGFGILTSFANIAVEDYKRIGMAAADISQQMGSDLISSFNQLAKALDDPIRGITALSRSGVTFTQDQRDMIKAMVESGDIMGAQKVILESIEQNYKDVATAAGSGSAAVEDSWGEALNRLNREMGRSATETLDPFKGAMTKVANFVVDTVVPAFESLPQPVQDALGSFGPFHAVLILADEGLKRLGLGLDEAMQGLRDLQATVASFDLGAAFQGMGDSIQSAFSGVGTAIGSLLNGLFNQVQSSLDGMINGITSAMRGLISWLNSALQGAVSAANSAIGAINRLPGINAPTIPIPQFAAGGVVDRPTLAMVGEGREREYIIPQSKMSGAMAAWGAGARGAAVLSGAATGPGGSPQINITTGPVMQQGGQDWVTVGDLESAVRSAATQIYATLRTPAGRRAIGVA